MDESWHIWMSHGTYGWSRVVTIHVARMNSDFARMTSHVARTDVIKDARSHTCKYRWDMSKHTTTTEYRWGWSKIRHDVTHTRMSHD